MHWNYVLDCYNNKLYCSEEIQYYFLILANVFPGQVKRLSLELCEEKFSLAKLRYHGRERVKSIVLTRSIWVYSHWWEC